MPAGLQVYNQSNGLIQIDQNYKTWGVRTNGSSGSWTSTTGYYYGSTMYYIDITVTATTPMLALSCENDVTIINISNSGSSWTWRILCNLNDKTLYWWVFDTQDNISIADNYGLEIFDDTGARVYHSTSKPLRVVGGGASGTFTGSVGRTYAAIICNAFRSTTYYPAENDYGPNSPGKSWFEWTDAISGINISGTIVNYGAVDWAVGHNEFTVQPADVSYGQKSFIIVDVTNY